MQRLEEHVATSSQKISFVGFSVCSLVGLLQHEKKAPLCFCVSLLVLYLTGGPAEGNADQLPVIGGWFHIGFTKTVAELIKDYFLCKGGRIGEVERTANRGQHPRQEEGIPSLSLHYCPREREHPWPGRSAKESNLFSLMGQTHTTVNKTHT